MSVHPVIKAALKPFTPPAERSAPAEHKPTVLVDVETLTNLRADLRIERSRADVLYRALSEVRDHRHDLQFVNAQLVQAVRRMCMENAHTPDYVEQALAAAEMMK
ncbi:hypothetical protein [Solimonas marina]|uniref:Uncharacterized protein n=1 Tax=Solimonas marina TaxID=2714601 RepID=A0A969W8M7_9GAMM|nr:hypothetical protein [Solimonas marina]NKF21544.1 hypothetical protein [Solimonas marina]